jgi:acetyl-CoA synthetase
VISAEAKVVITADQGVRGGKLIELKKTVVTAMAKCPSVTTILVSKRTGNTVVASPLDLDLDEVGSAPSPSYKCKNNFNQKSIL